MLGSKNPPRAVTDPRFQPDSSREPSPSGGTLGEIALDSRRVRRAFDALRPLVVASADAARPAHERGGAALELAAGSAGAVRTLRPSAAQAVVAAILRDGASGAEVLLIQRADNPLDPWSGHMALPGGRRDPSDPDLLETALRETLEEIGLDLRRDADLLGNLGSARTLSRGRTHDLTVLPLVFALAREQQPVPNPREVQRVLWAPLAHLISPASASSFEHAERGRRHRFPAFDVGGHLVWGLTHRVLSDLLAIVQPGWSGPRPQRDTHDGSNRL